MRSLRATSGILIALVVLTAVGVALAPLTSPVAGGADTDEFRSFMEPRLVALVDSSTAVNGMVKEKSRNILALRSESSRIETLVSEIDTWLTEHDAPGWADPIVRDYRDGAAKIQSAIDAAYAAIRSFDFSKMASMIPVFDEGTRLLQRALDTLRDSADTAFIVN
jgi:hypothetical protein